MKKCFENGKVLKKHYSRISPNEIFSKILTVPPKMTPKLIMHAMPLKLAMVPDTATCIIAHCLVKVNPRAKNARNFSQCDSLLMGNACGAHTFPYIESKNKSAQIEHEATTSKIGEDQLFYCNQRGIDTEKAIALIVNGFSKEVLNKLPMEFAVEAQ